MKPGLDSHSPISAQCTHWGFLSPIGAAHDTTSSVSIITIAVRRRSKGRSFVWTRHRHICTYNIIYGQAMTWQSGTILPLAGQCRSCWYPEIQTSSREMPSGLSSLLGDPTQCFADRDTSAGRYLLSLLGDGVSHGGGKTAPAYTFFSGTRRPRPAWRPGKSAPRPIFPPPLACTAWQ